MNGIKVKNCSTCGTLFNCGDISEGSKCWCNNFPPIFTPSEVVDCLCSNCFTTACSTKIDKYVATIVSEGIDYYLENGNYVFKAWFHLKRGNCCGNRCRHCPYGLKKI